MMYGKAEFVNLVHWTALDCTPSVRHDNFSDSPQPVRRVLFNPPLHARWRVKQNPPYAGSARSSSVLEASRPERIPSPQPGAVHGLALRKGRKTGKKGAKTPRDGLFPPKFPRRL